MDTFILRKKEDKFQYSEAMIVDNPDSLKIIDHPIRLQILKMLAKTPIHQSSGGSPAGTNPLPVALVNILAPSKSVKNRHFPPLV